MVWEPGGQKQNKTTQHKEKQLVGTLQTQLPGCKAARLLVGLSSCQNSEEMGEVGRDDGSLGPRAKWLGREQTHQAGEGVGRAAPFPPK